MKVKKYELTYQEITFHTFHCEGDSSKKAIKIMEKHVPWHWKLSKIKRLK